MRWIALAENMGFDVDDIEVYFIEGVFRISQMAAALKQEAERIGGEFGLVIIDTGPVFYEGDDENNRTQQGRHAELLRGLIDVVPGRPTVIANCHPTKKVDGENLVPAGGGNFLNQVDGNLTAAKTENSTTLHWQGKFRGVDFALMHFLIKTVTHERLTDSKGRLIPTVLCEWIDSTAQEKIERGKMLDQVNVLRAIVEAPHITQPQLAEKFGWKLHSGEPNKIRVGRIIKDLKAAKLIEPEGYTLVLTNKGKKHLEAFGTEDF
jgi:hypothetical protein